MKTLTLSLIVFLLTATQIACTQSPTKRSLNICPSCQKNQLNTMGKHTIQVFSKNLSNKKKSTLHIYLEGDGLPWSPKGYPNSNPNSKGLTALKLMALDSNPSIYINRPCYGHTQMPLNCSHNLWTSERYSDYVISSINNAIDEIQKNKKYKKIVLIGHSGGGTIAMLLAKRRLDVVGVVTMGANLDPDEWTEHFNAPQLKGSLNPTHEPILDKTIFRWHFAGAKDKSVPFKLTEKAASKDPYAHFFLEMDYDHNCCWATSWKDVLARLAQAS